MVVVYIFRHFNQYIFTDFNKNNNEEERSSGTTATGVIQKELQRSKKKRKKKKNANKWAVNPTWKSKNVFLLLRSDQQSWNVLRI